MTIIELNHIKQAYDDLDIFTDANLKLTSYEHIGLIGNNGTGKTTLIKIIMGEVEVKSGRVHVDQSLNIGYLKQVNEQSIDGEASYETLSKIGFRYYKKVDNQRLANLSGGERTKYQLAEIFEEGYDLIILDEPTNHLDNNGRKWLEDQLKSFYGAVIVISHDRHFLDQIADRIVQVDKGKLHSYNGNYSAYVEQRDHNRYTQEQAYAKQEYDKNQIEKEIKKLKNWSEKGHRESTKKTDGSGVKMGAKEKFRARAKKKDKQVKSKIKQLEKVEFDGVDRPEELIDIYFAFTKADHGSKKILSVEHVSKSFGDRLLFADAHFYIFRGERIGLMGDNGTGKSTLINMIRGLDYEFDGDIYLNRGQKVAYISQDILDLVTDQTVLESMELITKEQQSLGRQILAQMGITKDKVYRKISSLSMGERTRVKIAKLVLDQVDFLILDEPTNHLDIVTKETLEQALSYYKGTLLLCSHDHYLMQKICDKYLLIEEQGIKWKYKDAHKEKA